MAGGVVPVIGGFVIALQATKAQAKAMIVFILFLYRFSTFLIVLLLWCGRLTVIFSFQTSLFIRFYPVYYKIICGETSLK